MMTAVDRPEFESQRLAERCAPLHKARELDVPVERTDVRTSISNDGAVPWEDLRDELPPAQ